MKTKLLVALCALNVALFGVGFYFLNRAISETKPAQNAAISDPRGFFKPTKNQSNNSRKTVEKQAIIYVTNQFQWSQLESADYREYIANLRGVGCPENTIKDIIITDIMRLYAARRGQFYHNGREFKFWETNEKRKLNAKQIEERETQLAAIDKEIPAVLRELLGINYERELDKYFVDTNEDERRLDFLPEEKRSQLLSLRDEMEGLREKILAGRNESELSSAERAALRKIEEQRHDALAKILSPRELEDFELRTSETAERLREQLIGFNPSESEFREIYNLQKALDEKFASSNLSSAEKEAAEQELETAIRSRLGEARYAEFAQAKNPDFRSACLFSELYELPPSTAASLFDIQQVALEQRANLFANRNLPENLRAEALKAIRAETERTLRQILGTQLLTRYTQTSGKWIESLNAAN